MQALTSAYIGRGFSMGWILWGRCSQLVLPPVGGAYSMGIPANLYKKTLRGCMPAYPLQFKQQGACCLCAQMAFQELHSPSHALQELQSCNDLL